MKIQTNENLMLFSDLEAGSVFRMEGTSDYCLKLDSTIGLEESRPIRPCSAVNLISSSLIHVKEDQFVLEYPEATLTTSPVLGDASIESERMRQRYSTEVSRCMHTLRDKQCGICEREGYTEDKQ